MYVLVNGRLIEAPETTPVRFGPIMSRTLETAIKSMSKAQVIAVSQFADKYHMAVESAYLPFDFPEYSSADFSAATMRMLFNYGARCGESGRLWTTMDQTLAVVAEVTPSAGRAPSAEGTGCPLRDGQLAELR